MKVTAKKYEKAKADLLKLEGRVRECRNIVEKWETAVASIDVGNQTIVAIDFDELGDGFRTECEVNGNEPAHSQTIG